MMTWIFGLLFGVLAVPLALALPRVWPAFAEADHLRTFAAGAAGGALVTVVVLRKAPFLAVLEHELTHMLVALLHLRLPLSLNAGKDGGEVTYTGDSAFLIRLAPYVLPTFTLLALGLTPIVAEPHQQALRVAAGVTWGYHVATAFAEIRPHQPDLKTGGRVPAFLAVAGLGLLFYVGTALWGAGDFDLVRTWLDESVRAGRRLVTLAVG
jgi:hypothetical protein